MATDRASHAGVISEWLGRLCDAPARVAAFCEVHGILHDLQTAVELTENAFPARDELRVFLDHDPDDEREYIVVKVTLHADVPGFMRAYRQCRQAWAIALSPAGMDCICFGYNVL